MPNTAQNPHAAAAKFGSKTASLDRALVARLRELEIDPSGLPPHVFAHLRVEAEAESNRIDGEFASAVATLQTKAHEQTRKAIARLVTFRSVGKAFALPAISPPGGAAK